MLANSKTLSVIVVEQADRKPDKMVERNALAQEWLDTKLRRQTSAEFDAFVNAAARLLKAQNVEKKRLLIRCQQEQITHFNFTSFVRRADNLLHPIEYDVREWPLLRSKPCLRVSFSMILLDFLLTGVNVW